MLNGLPRNWLGEPGIQASAKLWALQHDEIFCCTTRWAICGTCGDVIDHYRVLTTVTTPSPRRAEQSAAAVAPEADADSCPHGCIFHWPQSWAKTSLTSTGIPPTTGPGFDTVLTMRW